jgi:cytochrome c peroxidase
VRFARRVWFLVLLSGTTVPLALAQAPDIDAAWRAAFRRPAAPPPAPPDNPTTPERVAFGAKLFADTRLSGDGRRSCATCHRPGLSFTDGRRRARGISGSAIGRNTPSLWNLAWSTQYFWDGRAPSLEEQVRGPIEAVGEMGGDWPAILMRVQADVELAEQFRMAFPNEPSLSETAIRKALAAYLRSLISPPSRFDGWIGGDEKTLTSQEVRGFRLFTGKAGCALCHAGWRFTDDRFHDIGLRSTDHGRADVKGGTPGQIAFKTPGLRDIARTAPHMHDGSLPTLAAVLAHYAGGFVTRPTLATNMNRRLRLTAREKADLIAFLKAL